MGSRYSATPVLLVWSAVLAEAVRLSKVTQRPMVEYVPAAACLILLVQVWVLDFRPASLRTNGPRSSEQVQHASTTCESHLKGEAILQISPPGWEIMLPCTDVS